MHRPYVPAQLSLLGFTSIGYYFTFHSPPFMAYSLSHCELFCLMLSNWFMAVPNFGSNDMNSTYQTVRDPTLNSVMFWSLTFDMGFWMMDGRDLHVLSPRPPSQFSSVLCKCLLTYRKLCIFFFPDVDRQ